jgi:hypothetical protein
MNFVNSGNFLIPYAVICVTETRKLYNSWMISDADSLISGELL